MRKLVFYFLAIDLGVLMGKALSTMEFIYF